MNDSLELKYSCFKCGVQRQPVLVRFREPGEDLMAWMKVATAATSRDHDKRSPRCRINTFSEFMIPAPVGENGVGCRTAQ